MDEWVFGPTAPYEVTGDVGRVVFPCGWVHDEATDRAAALYYGAADSSIGVATARFSDVLARVWRRRDRRRVRGRPARGPADAGPHLP